jgi:hypothetical protein
MKILLLVIFLFTVKSVVATEVTAPFGLKWGQTKKELTAKKVNLTDCSTSQKITSCKTINPVKGVSFGELYMLFIDDDKGLQKITMISKDITSDISGSEGKALYGKVKKSLTKKYSTATEYEYIGRKLYDEYDEFYQCLAYDGCGNWIALWEVNNGGNAIVQLKGLKRGKGYLTLTYESKEWSGIIDSLKQRENASDTDAL